jgi:CBS domain-containing protein
MLVKNIYNQNPTVVKDDLTVKQAVNLLLKNRFNGLLVTDKNNQLVGILSLQDIVGAIVPVDIQEHISLANAMYKEGFFQEMCQEIGEKNIKELMRKEYFSVSPDTSVMEIAADFLKNDLYIVPVMQDKKLVGIVTRSEIKKALATSMGLHRD